MPVLMLGTIYLIFFLSGAAALMYEVVWVRSLSLLFGGTHLAISTVLSVFMGGLALGSYVIGRFVDRVKKPLRLYGYLRRKCKHIMDRSTAEVPYAVRQQLEIIRHP
jgi:spermidine synthase